MNDPDLDKLAREWAHWYWNEPNRKIASVEQAILSALQRAVADAKKQWSETVEGKIDNWFESGQIVVEGDWKPTTPEGKAVLGAVTELQRAHDELTAQLAAANADRDEARAQREWLIKECARVGVTVNVRIGAPLTEAYQLDNAQLAAANAAKEELHKILGKKRVEIQGLKTQLAAAKEQLDTVRELRELDQTQLAEQKKQLEWYDAKVKEWRVKCGNATAQLEAAKKLCEQLDRDLRANNAALAAAKELLAECRMKLDWSVTDGADLERIDAFLNPQEGK